MQLLEVLKVTHKLTTLVKHFKEKYNFEIKGLDFHQGTIAFQKEIYPFAYAAWCFLSIIKYLEPSSVVSPRFTPKPETNQFWDHFYRREFFNEEKSVETTNFNFMTLQFNRTTICSRPKYFSTPSLLDELLPLVTAKVKEKVFSFWFNQQLFFETNFADPNQKSVFPEIQIRDTSPIGVKGWCNVLPGEWDECEIQVGEEKVHTKGMGKPFPPSLMYYGGHLGKKPSVILSKTKTDKIKLPVREELREIERLIGPNRILLVTEHEIWSKFFRLSLGIPAENICIDNRWREEVIKKFIDRHRILIES
ncbi:MAG: hypothetical protein ACE5R6_14040 [Candidatus Heimdallarchaeota archaeon]